jgi:uracil-DNA glycosylase family 4
MFEQIYTCQSCSVCQNQAPLLDEKNPSQVFWVGLSAKIITKEGEGPLSIYTKTGKLLATIEQQCPTMTFYRTNLVKGAPLNADKQLRYPSQSEMNACFPHLMAEINEWSPSLIVLLGEKVRHTVSQQLSITIHKPSAMQVTVVKYKGRNYVSVPHPSYVLVYQRQYLNDYVIQLGKLLNEFRD